MEIKIKVDEEEMREWAVKYTQKCVSDKIDSLMHDWDWKNYMKNAIDKAVERKITEEIACRIKIGD